MTASATSASGAQIDGVMFAWSSTDASVASVDNAGFVTAHAGGATLIRAAAGTVIGAAVVEVKDPALALANPYPSLFAGDTLQLRATVTYPGLLLPSHEVNDWEGGVSGVATVSGSGVVTAHAAGKATAVVMGPCDSQLGVEILVLEPRIGSLRELAYLSELGGDVVLKRVNPDGSGAITLSVPGEWPVEFSWSPDGSTLIIGYLETEDSTHGGSWLVDASGGNGASYGEYLWTPAWAPDGSRIAFRDRQSSGESDVFTMNPDGSDRRQITNAPGDHLAPLWAPDGRQLLYTHESSSGKRELWLIGVDGSHPRKITVNGTPYDPAWSPDGKLIAFHVSSDGSHPVIWLVSADGSYERELGAGRGFTWSPDGQRVGYSRGEELVIAQADGSGEIVVPLQTSCCDAPVVRWSPDGSRIAVGITYDSWPAVAIFGSDGSGPVIASGEENAWTARWRPSIP